MHAGLCGSCAYLCTRFTLLCAVSIDSSSCPCEHAWPQAALLFLVRLSGTSFFAAEQDENGDGARELKNMKSDRMKVLQMDVCSDQEVAHAVDFVKRTLKEPDEGMWESLYFQQSWLFAYRIPPTEQAMLLALSAPPKRGLTSLEACDSVWLAVRQCCEEN